MEFLTPFFVLSKIVSIFVTFKLFKKVGDRPPSIRGADFLYLSEK
nr:MAG TPA: hypothetical protein [Caudoviricetes sp.]DAX56722.1 MAG TPA: hypothetical protein [Caudoviricetes sp.]